MRRLALLILALLSASAVQAGNVAFFAELIRDLPPNSNSPESYPELQKLLQPAPHE